MKRLVYKLRKEVGDLPFDMLLDTEQSVLDPYAPSARVALAGQSDELCLAADTAEAVRAVFTNPTTRRYDDDDKLIDLMGDDVAGDTDMSEYQ